MKPISGAVSDQPARRIPKVQENQPVSQRQNTNSQRSGLPVWLMGSICLLIIALTSLIFLTLSDEPLSWSEKLQTLLASEDSLERFIIMELRLPRLITAGLAGAALGLAGCLVQGGTRNPLGSPDLMGVSSGASLAIVLAGAFLGLSPALALPFGIAGGFIAGLITFTIAWKTQLSPLHLTLSGMSIALFSSACMTLLLVAASSDVNGIYYWLAGSLQNRTWVEAHLLLPFVLTGFVLSLLTHRPLDLLMLDDISCRAIGLSVQRWRLFLGLIAVMLTAATVSVAGPLSFVGLIAPHIARQLLSLYSKSDTSGISCGSSHRQRLPLSMMTGATLVCVADTFAMMLTVPVGILCILTGGPLFVYLIRQQAKHHAF